VRIRAFTSIVLASLVLLAGSQASPNAAEAEKSSLRDADEVIQRAVRHSAALEPCCLREFVVPTFPIPREIAPDDLRAAAPGPHAARWSAVTERGPPRLS
jgi:hypothetical protein